MANFLTYYKYTKPNIYALMVSVLLALWYNGISGLFNYYFPDKGPILCLVFLLIPLIIFLTDDGKLDELYKIGDANPDVASNLAAVNVAAATIGTGVNDANARQKQQNFRNVTNIK